MSVKNIIPAEVTSDDIMNLTLTSGMTVTSSLVLLKGKVEMLTGKTNQFKTGIMTAANVKPDLTAFINYMKENEASFDTFKTSVMMVDNSTDTTVLDSQVMMLDTRVTEFETFVDGLTEMLNHEDLGMIQNHTTDILHLTNMAQGETLSLTAGLDPYAYADSLLLDASDAIYTTMMSLDNVLYVLVPMDQALISKTLNDQLAEIILLSETADSTEDANDLTRVVSGMTVQMMNVMLANLHGMQAKNTLKMAQITQNLAQVTVNLMYIMDYDKAMEMDALTKVNDLLKDLNKVVMDLAQITSSPKTGGVNHMMELESLMMDLNAILSDLTTILEISTDYTVWHMGNVTDDYEIVNEGSYVFSMNILGLVTFSIGFGIVIGRLGEDGKVVLKFFSATNEAVMKLVTLIMW